MQEYETPTSDVWTSSEEAGIMTISSGGTGGGGIPLPDYPL